MAKTKISEYSTTAGNNTDINNINLAEGCAPSGINDAIRELMRQLKEFQTGGAGDSVNSGGDFSVATNKFTVASATGNTSVAGTLGATGDFAVNTDKFTVAASSGNTAVGGTFAVTGATTLTGALVANGNSTLGDADTDTVTLNASFVNGTTLKTAKTATNTLALAAYDVDGTAYTNLVTLTAGNTPSLALTSTAVGTINNMSIGATTASTGAFTTLSASSDVTLSGGTANGVLYLNGSKVATSGSALTFDGTNFTIPGNLQSGGNPVLYSYNGATAGTVKAGIQLVGSDPSIRYTVNSSEQMRLNSTGLGIGTSSPSAKLEINGNVNLTNQNQGYYINLYYSGGFKYSANGYGYQCYGSTDGSWVWGNAGNNTSGAGATATVTERMRLDSSGNLGLGVTPSAWYSSRKAFQLGVGASLQASNSNYSFTELSANMNYNASAVEVYIGADYATKYRQISGTHLWYTAASGTAGNAITFTQAATLTSAGDYLVGKTALAYNTVGCAFEALGTVSATRSADFSGVFNRTTSDGGIIQFRRDNTAVGSISVTTSATAYNTSSDYRLKNIDGPLTGSGAFIDALKPKVGTWKADGSKFVGFLAHEVQEVSPGSVVGEKDGEQMQAMEYGSAEFIANIIAELQSLRARVAALES